MWTGLAGDAGYFFAGGVMKKTDWFPGDVSPARAGVYEIKGCRFDGINYRRWDGMKWSATGWKLSNFREGLWMGIYSPGDDMTGWRGLASDPKGK